VFEFFRHEELNARNFFAQPGPNPRFRRNQYGFTLGGPIQNNKTFFFADWQGSRVRTVLRGSAWFPRTPKETVFQPRNIFDPASSPRTQFVGNMIPLTRFDSLGKAILAHYPTANNAAASNFIVPSTEPDNQDQADFRVDRYFGERHRVFARYSLFRDDDTPVSPLPDGSGALTAG
jgi:hypothetical protein